LPDTKHRKGVLFYEATEGGAGVLTRLVHEPDALAKVARAALQVMHLDLSDDLEQAVPSSDALTDVAGTECVAGCYRCLLSYYNQPDHPLIDRRDGDARSMLLRLAMLRTAVLDDRDSEPVVIEDSEEASWEGRWRRLAAEHRPELPPPSRSEIGERVMLQWPAAMAAIAFPDTPGDIQRQWEDRGYTFVRFGEDESLWPGALSRLGRLIGAIAAGSE
jgi:hypothetical protein